MRDFHVSRITLHASPSGYMAAGFIAFCGWVWYKCYCPLAFIKKLAYYTGDFQGLRRDFMKPYSLDLRQRVVGAYENKEGPLRRIARRFKVSPNTVQAWVQHFRQVGSVAPKPHGGGGTPRIDAQGREKVRQLVTEQSDATL
jgi:transposase-like protein